MAPIRLRRILLLATPILVALYWAYQWDPSAPLSETLTEKAEHRDYVAELLESPVEGQFTRRIVAVGDLHGDMGNAQKVLHMADVVDAYGNWSGNIDFFVQTGDIIDRGDDTLKLFFWMDKLRGQARSVGGTVLSHLGNHEWMNVLSDWRYVKPSEIKTFGSVEARQKMLTTGRIGRSWAANYTTTSRLPLHPALGPPNTPYPPPASDPPSPLLSSHPLSHAALSFVHGGLAPDYSNLAPFPSRINEIAAGFLQKLQQRKPQPPPHPPNPSPGLPADATEDEKGLYAANGPLWYRGWAMDPEPKACDAVDAVLEKTGTKRMIMGHTPNFERIVSRCGGKIIIIDTGISHAYGGALSALSITYQLTPITEQGMSGEGQEVLEATSQKTKHWRERDLVVAIYEDRQELLALTERVVTGDF